MPAERFADDFERADGAGLGSDWGLEAGGWSIASGRAVPGASNQFAVAVLAINGPDASPTVDHYAEVVVNALSTRNAGPTVCGNTSDQACYAMLVQSASSKYVRLFQRSAGGSWTQLGSTLTGSAPGGQVTLRLERDGGTLTGFVNGSQVITHTLTSPLTGVRAGMHGNLLSGVPAFESFSMGSVADDPAPGGSARLARRRRILAGAS